MFTFVMKQETEVIDEIVNVETPVEAEPLIIDPPENPPVRKIKKVKRLSSDRPGKVKCRECGCRLTKTALGSHLQSHHGNDAYECLICQRLFMRLTSVRTHLKRAHWGVEGDSFQKKSRKNLSPSVLRELHSRLRSKPEESDSVGYMDIRQYNCYDCTSSFSSISELFDHCAVHRVSETGDKLPYLVPVTNRIWSHICRKWIIK